MNNTIIKNIYFQNNLDLPIMVDSFRETQISYTCRELDQKKRFF